MKNKILENYNKSNSLLVISEYPERNKTHGRKASGISSYAKNTLLALQKENPQRKIIILTTIMEKAETYQENDFVIVRCFKRNNPLSFLSILKNVLIFNHVKSILIEFEFASFGNIIATCMIVPLMWILFLLNKDITLVLHQVLFDLKKIAGHIGISANNPKTQVLNFGLKIFYKILTLPTKNIVVLEDAFKQRLESLIGKGKIVVIPHGIDLNITKEHNTKNNLEEKLKIEKDDFVILYFGYLTWYKGIDFLIQALKDVKQINGKKIKLIIAGGPSYTQGKKPHYQKFLRKIEGMTKGAKNITKTGFVEEKDIASIFEIANLVVFPYRTFMSSSGPLSLAISSEKPFILSRNLEMLLKSDDVSKALKLSDIKRGDILFDMNKKSLIKTIKITMVEKNFKKMLKLSKILKQERSFARLAVYYDEIISQDPVYELSQALSSA